MDSETSEARITAAKEYLAALLDQDADLLEVGKSFSLNYEKLLQDLELNESWPNLKYDLEENAEFVLGTILLFLNHSNFVS